jgi:DNA-binding beta-propeller fold protein YncE
MSRQSHDPRSLLHRLGVVGVARSRAFAGAGVPVAALAVTVALVVFLVLTVAPAFAFRGHVFEKSFGEKGPGAGQLNEPEGVAVNEATGDVYVVDKGNNRVEYFSETGAFAGEFNGSETPEKAFVAPGGIAVDNACQLHEPALTEATTPTCKEFDRSAGDVYVEDKPQRVIDKFSSTGAYIGQITGFGELRGVAVDPRGELWVAQTDPQEQVDNYSDAIANEFRGYRLPIGFDGLGGGLAADSEDDLYVRSGAQTHVAEYETKKNEPPFYYAGRLNETLDNETSVGSNGVAVEQSTGDVYIDNVASVGRFGPGLPSMSQIERGLPIERFKSGVLGGGTGIAVNSTNGRVYVAEGSTGEVQDYSLEPPGSPIVQNESVSEVTAASATFLAEINPRSEPNEPVIAYHFEYGPCSAPSTCASSAYGQSVPIPEGQLAPNYVLGTVSAHVQGLLPGMVYHFRVVAENEISREKQEPVVGGEEIFTTQSPGTFVLPDGREWELVSPPDKFGADLYPPVTDAGVTQASAGGDGIAYMASAPTEAQPAGNAFRSQVLSLRGAAGWSSRDIEVPHEEAVAFSEFPEIRDFSADLSLAAVQPLRGFDPSVSAEASEQTAFLRTDYLNGDPGTACVESCYRPLVTGAPGFADVPAGTEFGVCEAYGQSAAGGTCLASTCPPAFKCGPQFVTATPDFGHVVLASGAGLTEQLAARGGNLYEWSGSGPASEALQPLDVLPTSEGGGALSEGAVRGDVPSVATHQLTNDGSVFFVFGGHLYLDDHERGESVRLDVAQIVAEPSEAHAGFVYASNDGSRVLFSDPERLTSAPGGGVYECHVAEVAGQLACAQLQLTSLTGEGQLLGGSEDASYLYYLGAGDTLYVDHYDGTEWKQTVIATLSSEDLADGNGSGSGLPISRVSPDGGWLAFMSQESLTGYDNRDASSGKLDEEVYLYDATANGGAGRLICASCDPTDARPHGVEVKTLESGPEEGDLQSWVGERWLAASVPQPHLPVEGNPVYQARYLSDSGRLFFDSSDALVAQDTNGTEDVYEYEPAGVGGCSGSSSTFNGVSGGCVGLISSGSSPEQSGFLDASESGDDVFFLTAAQLSPRDIDTAFDVYDAHVCSAAVPCASPPAPGPPACVGDACQGAVSAPEDFTPGSLTFQGPGNPAASPTSSVSHRAGKTARCPRGKRRTHGRCVKSRRASAVKKKGAAKKGPVKRGAVGRRPGASARGGR